MEDQTNLSLSNVSEFSSADFERCRIHNKDGLDLVIDMDLAIALSRAQAYFQGQGIPGEVEAKLKIISKGRSGNDLTRFYGSTEHFGLTQIACAANYDLINSRD